MLNARCPAHPPTRSQSPLPSTLLTLSRKPWEPAVFPEANSPVSFYASLDRPDTLLLCITAFLMLVSPRGLENLQQPLFPPPLRPGTSQGPAASRPGVRGTGHSRQFAAGRTQALGLGVPGGQPRSAATVGKHLWALPVLAGLLSVTACTGLALSPRVDVFVPQSNAHGGILEPEGGRGSGVCLKKSVRGRAWNLCCHWP